MVHGIFGKMKRSGEALRALTYRGSFIFFFLLFFEHRCWFCVSAEKVAFVCILNTALICDFSSCQSFLGGRKN